MILRNFDYLLDAAASAGLPEYRILGHGIASGVRAMPMEDCIDAAVDGYLRAIKYHRADRGSFARAAFLCMESERRRYLRRRRYVPWQMRARTVNEAAPGDELAWRGAHVVDDAPQPWQEAATLDEADRVNAALAKLCTKDRATINAIYGQGLTRSEYGRRVGVTTTTVTKWHDRAIARLREMLR